MHIDSPSISEPILLDQYVATCDHTNKQANGLTLKAGNIVEVIIKGEHGKFVMYVDLTFIYIVGKALPTQSVTCPAREKCTK